ncbi:MAG: hypothetical protein KA765_07735 [Thermoflexales bacterium]|nr:hypothetical protein [Thermoflexales bacterium]
MSFVPLTGWVPDADETAPGVILDCTALIPSVRGMKGAPSAISSGVSALGAAALGAALIVDLAGTSYSFAGTATGMYKAGSSSWSDVTRASGAYTANTDTRWRFAQFGNTTVAVQKADRPQYSNSGAQFADIAFSGPKYAPKSALVETAQGFVVMADCNDTGASLGTSFGDQANRWWCSAQFDYTDWTPAASTQCASGLLVDSPGKITGLKRLGAALVAYKDTSLYVGTYVGPPAIWQWTMAPGEAGTASNESVVDIGDAHLFVGKSDFYKFDGSRPVAIGDGMREWFFSELNASYSYKIVALHDKSAGNVYWFYPSGSSSSLNACVVFNYRTGKWGKSDRSIETAVTYSSGGLAYSGLDTYTYATLPAVSYDSPFWGGGGGQTLAIINTSHALQFLTGTADSSSLVTSDFGADGVFSTVRRVRPRYLIAPSAATMVPAYRDITGETRTSLSTVTQSSGKFDYLKSARWHRFTIAFTGAVELTGLDVDAVNDGLE